MCLISVVVDELCFVGLIDLVDRLVLMILLRILLSLMFYWLNGLMFYIVVCISILCL